jgi:hypothetical protein
MARKGILGITALLLLTASILCLTIAGQASSVSLRLPVMEAKAGDMVDISVQATGAPGVGALQLDVIYDSAVLKPDSVSKGALLGKNSLLESKLDTAGRVMIALATLDNIKGNGDILTIRFKVIGQSGQNTSLKLENAFAWEGESHQDILVKLEPGQLKVIGGSSFLIWIIIAIVVILLMILLFMLLSRRRKKAEKTA